MENDVFYSDAFSVTGIEVKGHFVQRVFGKCLQLLVNMTVEQKFTFSKLEQKMLRLRVIKDYKCKLLLKIVFTHHLRRKSHTYLY